MTPEDLLAFEERIATAFNRGEIPYPVHLRTGGEESLIEIFQDVGPNDWIFGSWRLHCQALLKGVPQDELEAAIRRGESMALRFPRHRVYGSAIAGGCVPIALGVALAIKRREESERVWLFMGDMVAESGIAHETVKYAANFNLPLTVVVENNLISVCTPTRVVWGLDNVRDGHARLIRYDYQSKYPHAGAGVRVQF